MYVNVEGKSHTTLTFLLKELEYYFYNCYRLYDVSTVHQHDHVEGSSYINPDDGSGNEAMRSDGGRYKRDTMSRDRKWWQPANVRAGRDISAEAIHDQRSQDSTTESGSLLGKTESFEDKTTQNVELDSTEEPRSKLHESSLPEKDVIPHTTERSRSNEFEVGDFKWRIATDG